MTTRTPRQQALREALVLLVIVVAALAAGVTVRQRPDGPDEVKIPIEALRSQFAELALLEAQAGDVLPPRFVRAQAAQLRKAIEATRDELEGLRPPPALQAPRSEALAHASQLLVMVDALRGSGSALPRTALAELDAGLQRLKAQEEGLRR
jgi:hypothetical protein